MNQTSQDTPKRSSYFVGRYLTLLDNCCDAAHSVTGGRIIAPTHCQIISGALQAGNTIPKARNVRRAALSSVKRSVFFVTSLLPQPQGASIFEYLVNRVAIRLSLAIK